MGHRPIPTAPPYEWPNNGPQEHDAGPAYLYLPLPQFIAEISQEYADWEEFMEEYPELHRALISGGDLE